MSKISNTVKCEKKKSTERKSSEKPLKSSQDQVCRLTSLTLTKSSSIGILLSFVYVEMKTKSCDLKHKIRHLVINVLY